MKFQYSKRSFLVLLGIAASSLTAVLSFGPSIPFTRIRSHVVSPDRGTIRIRGRFDQSPVELSVLDSSDSSTPEDLEHEPSKTGIATDVNQMRPNSTPSRLLSLRIFFYNLRFIPYYLWFIPFACC